MDKGTKMITRVNSVKPKELPNMKHVEEDKGYVSLYTPNCSPVPGTSKGNLQEDYGCPESPSEPLSPKQAATRKIHVNLLVDEVSPTASVKPVELGVLVGDLFFSDVEQELDIGLPLFESSMCQNLKVHDASTEQSRNVSHDETQENVSRTLPSFDSTLPLDVQVKSKVVVPSRHNPSEATQRPLSYNEEEWETKKEDYANLVRRHMNENTPSAKGAMSELDDLMRHVADRTQQSNGETWQHPSDFTRQNYRQRFGKEEAKMTLHEWQVKSNKAHKRFSNVPKIFARF